MDQINENTPLTTDVENQAGHAGDGNTTRRVHAGGSDPVCNDRMPTEKVEASNESTGTMAVRLSFGINVVLFIVKVTVVALSGSLVVIASALDSFVDLLSGTIRFVFLFCVGSAGELIMQFMRSTPLL